MRSTTVVAFLGLVFLATGSLQAQFSTVWQLGVDDGGFGVFVQEGGTMNDPPGEVANEGDRLGDDDTYIAGTYPDPIGEVAEGEDAVERAFVASDPNIRLHFNLPADVAASDIYRFTTEPLNLDGNGAPPSYSFTATFNGVQILAPTFITTADLNVPIATSFTAGHVGAVGGPLSDNVIELVGSNIEGGGGWMGFDYHRLEKFGASLEGVPAVSEYALLGLSIALVGFGGFYLRRRQRTQTA